LINLNDVYNLLSKMGSEFAFLVSFF